MISDSGSLLIRSVPKFRVNLEYDYLGREDDADQPLIDEHVPNHQKQLRVTHSGLIQNSEQKIQTVTRLNLLNGKKLRI